jgi:hypothetical protein
LYGGKKSFVAHPAIQKKLRPGRNIGPAFALPHSKCFLTHYEHFMSVSAADYTKAFPLKKI